MVRLGFISEKQFYVVTIMAVIKAFVIAVIGMRSARQSVFYDA